ncbi:MAG: thioredoxin family protein [Bacteroidota bacterium]
MRKIILVFIVYSFALISCNSYRHVQYETIYKGKEKTLKGVLNRAVIESDTTFPWFKENMKWGTIDENTINTFKTKADKFNLIVFGGTWCEDTQNILPKFYKLIAASNYPEKKILLLGVDRKKNTIDSLNVQYKITNVPTFIVMHKGKEVGRVVEYGTKGDVNKELADIVNTIP